MQTLAKDLIHLCAITLDESMMSVFRVVVQIVTTLMKSSIMIDVVTVRPSLHLDLLMDSIPSIQH